MKFRRWLRSPRFWYLVSLVLGIFAVVGFAAGCAAPTWLSDAGQVIPEIVQTIEAILSLAALAAGTALSASEQNEITAYGDNAQTALDDIEQMVDAYNQNNSPSVLANIEAAVQSWISNATSFLSAFHIDNQKLETEIVDFVTLALTQFKAWATLLPTLSAMPGESITIVIPMSKKQYGDNFNAIRTRKTGDAAVDAALAKLKKF